MTTAATPTTENSAAPVEATPAAATPAAVTPATPPVTPSTPRGDGQVTPPADATPPKAGEEAGNKDSGDNAGDKPGDKPAEPAKVVPEKYDLKLSQDSLGDKILVDKIADYAKSQGLSQEEASTLLANHEQAIAIETKERSEQWLKEAQSDPVIGGEKLKEASENTRRALKAFDPSGRLTKMVDGHGYGNHPAFIEFGHNIGEMLKSHPYITASPGAATERKAHQDILYGS